MNQHKFAFRVGVLVLLIAVMAGVFSVRLHNVQITQAAEQDPTPSGSVTYHTRVTAARGEILDRNGNVLVGNRASYNLVIVREVLMSADAPNENLRRLVDLCSELGLEYTDHFPVTQEKPYAYVDSGSSLWDGYFRTFLTERGWDTDWNLQKTTSPLPILQGLPTFFTSAEPSAARCLARRWCSASRNWREILPIPANSGAACSPRAACSAYNSTH